eukprot:scaffold19260_cov66-Phaeocystis_antarctica.AAC.2
MGEGEAEAESAAQAQAQAQAQARPLAQDQGSGAARAQARAHRSRSRSARMAATASWASLSSRNRPALSASEGAELTAAKALVTSCSQASTASSASSASGQLRRRAAVHTRGPAARYELAVCAAASSAKAYSRMLPIWRRARGGLGALSER